MNKKGFTLVEIMIVVAIIGLLAAIAIPSFMKSRQVSQANACVNNLRQIDSGKEQAAMTMGWTENQAIDAAGEAIVDEYIRGGRPECPVAAADPYTYGNVGARPICSITPDAGSRNEDGTDHWLEGFDEAAVGS